MQQSLGVSDPFERPNLVMNIQSMWNVADATYIIPGDMRYPGWIGNWPLPILRSLSYLASGMPGDGGRHRFVELLNLGYTIRVTDESTTHEPQLQVSDLEFVRDSVGLPPAAMPVEEEAAPAQNDVATPQPRPQRILPEDEDDPETLMKKQELWIKYYWNVTDIKALVPPNMRQLDKFGKPTNRPLHSCSDQRNLTKTRPAGRGGGKAFAESDVKVALDHFRDLREEEEDDDSVTNSRKQLPIAPSNPDGTTGEEGQDGATNAQRGSQHLDGRQRKRRRRESRATEPNTQDGADDQTLLPDVDIAEAGLSMAHSRRSSVMARRDKDCASSIATHDATVDEAASSLQGARGASNLPLKRKIRYSLDGDETDVDEEGGKTGDDEKDERAELEHDELQPEDAQEPPENWAMPFETEDAPQDGEVEDTHITIGDVKYDVDLSQIPYLSSFADFQAKAQPDAIDLVHGPIPLFDVALKGIQSGYRQCFRNLPPELQQYHVLCETYEFLGINVLEKRRIDQIFSDLRICKIDWDPEDEDTKGVKSRARDAAFRLLYLILLGEFEDDKMNGDKAYNAVLFVLSHPATFKSRTRTVVRAAYEERFVASRKQIKRLDQWLKGDTADDSEEATTTDEESPEEYYGPDEDYESDWS
ncbi:uncharacterized protein J4E78_010603 [Alternaria triticimaculans]|uniref:uncharacterized protein n=1 Tax=Alternaria triticimaculans TaxID=297637 RepID=UPI0020C4C215|nr:uncharacterized protein J4E78_010603 [Alternaria triticimaculans]KAI4640580.1 hypothetical protein J4E78_010603 [Alternaria triticimaculans]